MTIAKVLLTVAPLWMSAGAAAQAAPTAADAALIRGVAARPAVRAAFAELDREPRMGRDYRPVDRGADAAVQGGCARCIYADMLRAAGLGDLRGMRHLFTAGKYHGRASAFFSIDGTSLDGFTTGGVGSQRYRLAFKGPGGHSFGVFGLVNPMTALAQAVVDLYKLPVPAKPKTTFSASVVGGGTSVNAIPRDVWLEVDMRSESAAELATLETAS